jgi:hypothetical protein
VGKAVQNEAQFINGIAACIRKLSVLKGGPQDANSAKDHADVWVRVMRPMLNARYPLEGSELVAAVDYFLARKEPWFPTAGEFLEQIERHRTTNWVTVSRLLEPGEDGKAGTITFIKCPPEKVEEARRELFSRDLTALPAPPKTATDEQIERLRSLKGFGLGGS